MRTTQKPLPLEYIKERFFVDAEGQLFRRMYPEPVLCDAGLNCNGRGRLRINGDWYYTARVVYALTYGVDPGEMLVDHQDRNPSNNRPWNLRLLTPSGNSQNRGLQYNSTSGVTGISWHIRHAKWHVSIYAGQDIHLGLFEDFFEAVCARKSAENKYHPK